MPYTWVAALNNYLYPVDLTRYEGANQFPGFFIMNIQGHRNHTIEFENRFQALAPKNTPAYLGVIFWKLFSQANVSQRGTTRIANHLTANRVAPDQLWTSIQGFIRHQDIARLQAIRKLLGIKTPVLAVALTLVSFADSANFPMVDRQVAGWVNNNHHAHNANRNNRLSPFIMNYTSLRDNDFPNYLN